MSDEVNLTKNDPELKHQKILGLDSVTRQFSQDATSKYQSILKIPDFLRIDLFEAFTVVFSPTIITNSITLKTL
jgi:hypothetical protein